MNELEKAYQEIEGWHCYAEQEGFVNEKEISYLDYVKKCINNLQSKIDKANEILDKLEMQPAYLDCKYYELGGFNELRNALKEDK